MKPETEFEYIEKWCSYREDTVKFRKEYLIYYDKFEKQPPRKGKDICTNRNNCDEIDCKWSNGKGKDYLIDISE